MRDGLWADFWGSPLTDRARITERFRRPNYGTLEVRVTVDDPKAYTRPWTVSVNQHIAIDTDLLEYACLENEKDVQRLVEACANRRQTLLFSATTGGSGLREMVASVLREPQHLMLNAVGELSETTRQQIITADDPLHKERLVHWLLEHESYRKAIVFTNTRALADRLYGHLVAAGHKAFVLHGEKDQKDRKLAIERLKQGGARGCARQREQPLRGGGLPCRLCGPVRPAREHGHRRGRAARTGRRRDQRISPMAG